MKKLILLIILILCVGCSSKEERVINVLNWSSYIPMDVIENFEKDEECNVAFAHNPFSLPQGTLEEIKKAPLEALAYQYDLIINGYESLSGAVRNHSQEMMVELFKLAGYGKEVVVNKFPALYNAFSYGAPPHAGSAPGFDRLMMLLTHNEYIRDIYAFPMNKNGQDPLCNAPNVVDEKLLRDVHIKLLDEQDK